MGHLAHNGGKNKVKVIFTVKTTVVPQFKQAPLFQGILRNIVDDLLTHPVLVVQVLPYREFWLHQLHGDIVHDLPIHGH